MHVEWKFQGRLFRLVDTAGLTRVLPDQRLLRPEVDRKYKDVFNSLGFGTTTAAAGKPRTPNVRVVLPGIEVMFIASTTIRCIAADVLNAFVVVFLLFRI